MILVEERKEEEEERERKQKHMGTEKHVEKIQSTLMN